MSRPAVSAIALEHRIDVHELLEDYEERAAVREFEGCQPRADSERDAIEDCRRIAISRSRR